MSLVQLHCAYAAITVVQITVKLPGVMLYPKP